MEILWYILGIVITVTGIYLAINTESVFQMYSDSYEENE